MVLGLAREWTPSDMQAELPRLRRVVEKCGNQGFDTFMAACIRAMLVSRGYSHALVERAITMEKVVTAFERGLKEMVHQGREQGIRQGRQQGIRQGRQQGQVLILQQIAARKFGSKAAVALSSFLDQLSGAEPLDRITNAILECDASEDFIARLRED